MALSRCKFACLISFLFSVALFCLIIGSGIVGDADSIENFPILPCKRWAMSEVRYIHGGKQAAIPSCAMINGRCIANISVHIPALRWMDFYLPLQKDIDSVRQFIEQNSIERNLNNPNLPMCMVECVKNCFFTNETLWAGLHNIDTTGYVVEIFLSVASMIVMCIFVGRRCRSNQLATNSYVEAGQPEVFVPMTHNRSDHL